MKRLNEDKSYTFMQGHWIIELPELSALKNTKTNEVVKAFLSRQKDTYRTPYDRYPRDRKRQCVFGGTTNEKQFLPLDRTGNRRFLPVEIHAEQAEVHILTDEAASREYFRQMWAEIMAIRAKGNISLKLPEEVEKAAAVLREEFSQKDTDAGQIYDFMETCRYRKVCSRMLYREALGKTFEDPKLYELRAITEIVNTGIASGRITGWKAFQGSQRFQTYETQRGWNGPKSFRKALSRGWTGKWKQEKMHLTEESVRRERDMYRKYIASYRLAGMKITDVKASDIESFFTSYSEQITRHTLGNIKSVLNGIFDYAVASDLVPYNVARQYNTRTIKTVAETSHYDVYTDSDRARNVLQKIRNSYGTGTTYVFTSKNGKFIYETPFGEHLRAACEKAGVQYRSSHKIRFWAASSLASNGASVQDLMSIGGWSNTKTAMRYIRMNNVGKRTKRLFEETVR